MFSFASRFFLRIIGSVQAFPDLGFRVKAWDYRRAAIPCLRKRLDSECTPGVTLKGQNTASLQEGQKMTIAETAKKYDISADTLRYYERIGLIPPVPRTKSGIRDYDETSCGWVEFIKCMRGAGLQIEALIEYVALFQQGEATVGARKAILIEQREQLAERITQMQQTLERLDSKIAHYGSCVSFENALREGEQNRK